MGRIGDGLLTSFKRFEGVSGHKNPLKNVGSKDQWQKLRMPSMSHWPDYRHRAPTAPNLNTDHRSGDVADPLLPRQAQQ